MGVLQSNLTFTTKLHQSIHVTDINNKELLQLATDALFTAYHSTLQQRCELPKTISYQLKIVYDPLPGIVLLSNETGILQQTSCGK